MTGNAVIELESVNKWSGDLHMPGEARPTKDRIAASAPFVGHFYRIVSPQ